jgi:hypothetical protein
VQRGYPADAKYLFLARDDREWQGELLRPLDLGGFEEQAPKRPTDTDDV